MTGLRRALALLTLCAALPLAGCFNVDFMFFPGEALDEYTLPDNHIPEDQLEEVSFSTGGGETIYGIWAYGDPGMPTLLYSHGNHKHLDTYWDRVMLKWDMGYTVFVYDYPSYGKSTGEPTEDAIFRSATAAHDHVVERLASSAGGPPLAAELGVIYYGFSLGSAPAIYQAAEVDEPAALITEAALASSQGFVEDSTRVALPASLLVTMELDNVGRIPRVQAPKMFMHGALDDYIGAHFSEILYDAADAPKELWLAPNGEHGNMVCDGYSSDCIDAPDESYNEWRAAVSGFTGEWVPVP
jgi:hypothetical protein